MSVFVVPWASMMYVNSELPLLEGTAATTDVYTYIYLYIYTLSELSSRTAAPIQTQNVALTPADGHVEVEVLPLTKDSDDQQAVQVDALHQQPVVVGHHTVLHHHHGATAPRHCLAGWTDGRLQNNRSEPTSLELKDVFHLTFLHFFSFFTHC